MSHSELERLLDLLSKEPNLRAAAKGCAEVDDLIVTQAACGALATKSNLGQLHPEFGRWVALATELIQFMALAQIATLIHRHDQARTYISHAEHILASFVDGIRRGHAHINQRDPKTGN
jgi:hypothetical protein